MAISRASVNFDLSRVLSSRSPPRLAGILLSICYRGILQNLEMLSNDLHVKMPRVVFWCLLGKEEERGKKPSALYNAAPFRAPKRESITTPKHRTSLSSRLPPSSFNTLRWWTCVRWCEKVLHQSFAAVRLGSSEDPCGTESLTDAKASVLLAASGHNRPRPTDQLLKLL